MKLLVSDYDGTLKVQDSKININVNVSAIHKLQDNGHKFMISTGRNYNSIKSEISKYNIPYDYLSCNDGAVLFDKDGNLIKAFYLDDELLLSLIEEIKNIDIVKGFDLYDIYDKSTVLSNIVEIAFYTKIFRSKKCLKEMISKYYGLDILSFPDASFIETIGGKSRSIKVLEGIEKFDYIITVGDGSNDIAMLKDYNGYKMLECSSKLLFKGLKTTSSVYSLVKKMTN